MSRRRTLSCVACASIAAVSALWLLRPSAREALSTVDALVPVGGAGNVEPRPEPPPSPAAAVGASRRTTTARLRFLECAVPLADRSVVVSFGSSTVSARTGPDGRCSVDLPIGCDEVRAGVAVDARTVEERLQLAPDREIDVDLSPEPRLRGVVRDVAGAPIHGALVLAWPSGSGAERAGSARRSSDPPASTSRSGADGRHVLCGLAGGTIYSVVAVGDGAATSREHTIVATEGEARLDLVLSAVRICLVHVTDLDGNTVRLPAGATSSLPPSGVTFPVPSGWKPCDPGRYALRAAGVPEEHLSGRLGYGLSCVQSSAPDAACETLEIVASCYGHESAVARVPLQRLGPGLVSTEVRLTQRRLETGELRVHMTNADECPERGQPPGSLTLRRLDASGRSSLTLALTVSGAPSSVLRFDGIERGRYRATIQAESGFFRFPARDQAALEITIGPTPAELAVDLAPTACVELRVHRPDGRLHDGPLAAYLYPEHERRGLVRALSFRAPPYRLSWMTEGRYRLKVRTPGLSWHGEAEFPVARGLREPIRVDLVP